MILDVAKELKELESSFNKLIDLSDLNPINFMTRLHLYRWM